MKELPAGWRWVPIDELAEPHRSGVVIGPFGSNLKVSDYRDSGVPLVFVRNIRSGDFRGERRFVSPMKAAELVGHQVVQGDVLITKMGDPPGDAAVYRSAEPAVITADCIRVHLGEAVLPEYLAYSFGASAVRDQVLAITRGVAQKKVSLDRFRTGVSIPIPNLHEQQRIVEILEGHLSRLDAAERSVAAAARRLEAWGLSSLWHETHGHQGSASRLAEVAEVRLGRQRSPANHSGPRMRPYLRAANVHWDRLRLDDVKEMHFSSSEESELALQEGDILVVEASGSRHEVGKSAVYRGEVPGACFQNTLLRVRVGGANPDFVQKYLLAEAWAGRLVKESRGVGIHHIGRARLAGLPVSLPSIEAQRDAVARASSALDALERARGSLAAHHVRADQLRGSLLTAAFSGQLT